MQKTYVLQLINKKQRDGGQLLKYCAASSLFGTLQHIIFSALLLSRCLLISPASYHILLLLMITHGCYGKLAPSLTPQHHSSFLGDSGTGLSIFLSFASISHIYTGNLYPLRIWGASDYLGYHWILKLLRQVIQGQSRRSKLKSCKHLMLGCCLKFLVP